MIIFHAFLFCMDILDIVVMIFGVKPLISPTKSAKIRGSKNLWYHPCKFSGLRWCFLLYLSGLDTLENPGIYEKYMHSGQIACTGTSLEKHQFWCWDAWYHRFLLNWDNLNIKGLITKGWTTTSCICNYSYEWIIITAIRRKTLDPVFKNYCMDFLLCNRLRSLINLKRFSKTRRFR